mmetsp:Transcript_20752/g.37758  ORF Transcript_20752/g.37758 Transcript_20752/m.37758 type:complete len:717 (-) Transcript_20752:29-2179(-)
MAAVWWLIPLQPGLEQRQLAAEGSLTVGRKGTCTYIIPEEFAYVSGEHCRFHTKLGDAVSSSGSGPGVEVEDLSANGTFVNGVKVGRGKRGVAKIGEEISLAKPTRRDGALKFKLQLQANEAQTSNDVQTAAPPPPPQAAVQPVPAKATSSDLQPPRAALQPTAQHLTPTPAATAGAQPVLAANALTAPLSDRLMRGAGVSASVPSQAPAVTRLAAVEVLSEEIAPSPVQPLAAAPAPPAAAEGVILLDAPGDDAAGRRAQDLGRHLQTEDPVAAIASRPVSPPPEIVAADPAPLIQPQLALAQQVEPAVEEPAVVAACAVDERPVAPPPVQLEAVQRAPAVAGSGDERPLQVASEKAVIEQPAFASAAPPAAGAVASSNGLQEALLAEQQKAEQELNHIAFQQREEEARCTALVAELKEAQALLAQEKAQRQLRRSNPIMASPIRLGSKAALRETNVNLASDCEELQQQVAQLRQRSDRMELDLQPLEESLVMKRRNNERLRGELHDERACAERLELEATRMKLEVEEAAEKEEQCHERLRVAAGRNAALEEQCAAACAEECRAREMVQKLQLQITSRNEKLKALRGAVRDHDQRVSDRLGALRQALQEIRLTQDPSQSLRAGRAVHDSVRRDEVDPTMSYPGEREAQRDGLCGHGSAKARECSPTQAMPQAQPGEMLGAGLAMSGALDGDCPVAKRRRVPGGDWAAGDGVATAL